MPYLGWMTGARYHAKDNRSLGRRVMHLLETERMQVSCQKCGRVKIFGHETFKHFMPECALSWLEEDLPPRCWKMSEIRPADCQREVTWLDASDEDCGVGD